MIAARQAAVTDAVPISGLATKPADHSTDPTCEVTRAAPFEQDGAVISDGRLDFDNFDLPLDFSIFSIPANEPTIGDFYDAGFPL
jgi:hypothetical protein